ncbi:MAG: hypothetical protein ABI721_05225 [Candidatus Dojkabacteria bacterium]
MNDDNKKPEDDELPPMPTTLPEEVEEITEIDIAPTDDISTTPMPVPTSEDEDAPTAMGDNSQGTTDDVPSTWLEIVDGKFKCSECENEVEPETNSIEGVVKADLDQIKADLTLYPTKVVYGICPVCGMEFVFRLMDEKLYLEPSDLEK